MNYVCRKIQIALEYGLDNRTEAADLLRDAQDEINRLENLVPRNPRLYRVISHPDLIVLKRDENTHVVVWTKDSLDHADPYPTCVPSNIFRVEELSPLCVENVLALRKMRGFKAIHE